MQTITLKRIDLLQSSYCETIAAALIRFARADPSYSAWLAAHMHSLRRFFPEETASFSPTIFMLGSSTAAAMPRTRAEAIQKTQWLYAQMMRRSNPDAARARILLDAWTRQRAQTHEGHRQIVIGIRIGAALGLTTGRISAVSAQRNERIPVVISQDALTVMSAAELAAKIIQTTGALLADAFSRAGGLAEQLDPEMHKWLFGDRATELYAGSREALESAHRELASRGVANAALIDEKGPALLALAPAKDERYEALLSQLKPLGQ